MNHTTQNSVVASLREERDRALECLDIVAHRLESEHDACNCDLDGCASCDALFAAREVLDLTPMYQTAGGAAA